MAAPTSPLSCLLVGDWHFDFYEAALAKGLERAGWLVSPLPLMPYFGGLLGKAERKYLLPGPRTLALNRAVVAAVRAQRPTVVFLWRCTHVWPRTVATIQALGARVVVYNNDNPYSLRYRRSPHWHQRRLWAWWHGTVPLADLACAYRLSNLADLKAAGARRTTLLRSWFIPERDRPVVLSAAEQERFGAEAVFVGHYEEDDRAALLAALAAAGVRLRLWGTDWAPANLGPVLAHLHPVRPARGDDYARALCGGQVALCFLSTLQGDTYTRRCFEIPACRVPLVAPRNPDLASLFAEGTEAAYFDSPAELVAVVQSLLADPAHRAAMVEAAHARLLRDGHSVYDRARVLAGELAEMI